jgi:hypothetical protein
MRMAAIAALEALVATGGTAEMVLALVQAQEATGAARRANDAGSEAKVSRREEGCHVCHCDIA